MMLNSRGGGAGGGGGNHSFVPNATAAKVGTRPKGCLKGREAGGIHGCSTYPFMAGKPHIYMDFLPHICLYEGLVHSNVPVDCRRRT